MNSYPEVGDLRLVDAIARHGSLGRPAVTWGPRLSLVSLVPTAPHWKSALPLVRRELGLSVAPSLT